MKFKWNIRKKEIDYFGHISKEELDELEDDFKYIDIIDFKCIHCGKSAELEADIVLECFNSRYEEYPVYTCMHCNKEKLVPLDVYNQLSIDFYYPFKD